jgi:hypothetical protein
MAKPELWVNANTNYNDLVGTVSVDGNFRTPTSVLEGEWVPDDFIPIGIEIIANKYGIDMGTVDVEILAARKTEVRNLLDNCKGESLEFDSRIDATVFEVPRVTLSRLKPLIGMCSVRMRLGAMKHTEIRIVERISPEIPSDGLPGDE